MRYGIEVALIDWAPNKSALTAYFQSCVRETAIVAHSDQYAIDAIRVAERSGLRVPEDLSVVGFDSTAFCETHSPKLTSISQPLEAMGERAVDLLVAMLENRFAGPMETVLPCGFDVRESTGPAASRR